MKRIVLASGSPRRKELLTQIGMKFTIHPSDKEEQITTTVPSEVVLTLSNQKAEDVWESLYDEQNDIIVIGADTVVACEDAVLGKPKDEADALRMLAMIQGKEHQVWTGVTMLWNEEGVKKHYSFYAATSVVLYSMTQEEILKYIRSGESMDKAGAYGIQGSFAAFIKSIRGEYNNVVGLPVGRLYHEMKAFHLLDIL